MCSHKSRVILLIAVVDFLEMASNPAFNEQDGTEWLVSETPPAHYIVKIQSFSLLAKNNVDKYETGVFQAGGYKWKLTLHPNGNKAKNVKAHVSVYLSMAETSSLSPSWEVYAVVRLFLLDQNKDNYLIAQDPIGKHRRFHWMKPESGFDQFIPLKTFADSKNGYLVDDSCALGAEIFVSKERNTVKGEKLVMMIKDSKKHLWRINNYSKLEKEYYDSSIFAAGIFNWNMRFYPNGKGMGLGSCISLYLDLAEALSPGTRVLAEFSLKIIDQVQGRTFTGKDTHWFSAASQESGWERFILLATFKSNGYLVNDSCSVEAEVSMLGVVTPL